jgi:hypothetical protein
MGCAQICAGKPAPVVFTKVKDENACAPGVMQRIHVPFKPEPI